MDYLHANWIKNWLMNLNQKDRHTKSWRAIP